MDFVSSLENPKRLRICWSLRTSRMKRKNPHAVALGRRGGQIGGAVKSAIKTLAARENGKKGGRPPKEKKREIV